MKQVKLIFVDCDGVLYPLTDITYDELVAACQRAGSELGIDWSDFDAVRQELKDKKVRGLYNALYELCHRQGIDFKSILIQMVRYVDYNKLSPDSEMLSLLQRVAKKMPLYILTNNSRPHLECVFQHLFACSVADSGLKVITAEDTLRHGYFQFKQMDGALTEQVALLHQKPKDVLLLDDTEAVIQAAQDQGIPNIRITGPEMTKEILKGFL